MSQLKKLLQLLELRDAVSSIEIQAHLAVSQAAVSRLIAEVANEIAPWPMKPQEMPHKTLEQCRNRCVHK